MFSCLDANATDDVKVTATLDSAKLLMGYTTRLQLSVEQPIDKKVDFPLLRENTGKSYIGLLGDSIEISPNVILDTVRVGKNRIKVNYNLTLQAFDSGYYKLPEFVFTSAESAYKSNKVDLTVLPVKVADDAEISGFTSIEEPLAVGKESDTSRENWFKKYWWLILLLLLSAAGIIWGIRKYRKEGTLLPVKPVIPPVEEARNSLKDLRSRKLWETGKEKEYYTKLTYILRRYLSREFGIPAMEMTSRQIMDSLKKEEDLRELRIIIRELLDISDFVKYAKVRPLPEDNEKSFSSTLEFINSAHSVYDHRLQLAEESDKRGKEKINTGRDKDGKIAIKKRKGIKMSSRKKRDKKRKI